ncbi:hypothetical protein NEISICOT_03339 [Neisseria sicca ATCC 29256]|uniref:Uncharacterized protein n=1 Tax=Neisseria sicca ATCC 29256 TaxID=547045 RepID=C6M9V8_NEISI|nr:hypothetical protein NEISICOT_03339 [Neisseria sicca ATCC 29256]
MCFSLPQGSSENGNRLKNKAIFKIASFQTTAPLRHKPGSSEIYPPHTSPKENE